MGMIHERSRGIKSRDKIYEFIGEYIKNHDYSPTIREICAGVGLRSTSSVYYQLSVLERQERIKTEHGKVRTIKILK